MDDFGEHKEFVATALRRLSRVPAAEPTAVRVLAGGRSGSRVYRLQLGGEDVVLKVTLPGGSARRIERARREARFYQTLARRVPLTVPRLIDSDFDADEGVVLLLAAAEPSPPPDDWSAADFGEVARQLGLFHAMFWGRTTEFAMPGWIRDKRRVTVDTCRRASRHWNALFTRDDLREIIAPYEIRLKLLLLSIGILEPTFAPKTKTLCHGDCHTGNLLRGPDGAWLWVDWQDLRMGPGVDDLSFLWQRAFAATDTPPPYEALVDGYRAGLEPIGEAQPTRQQLERDLAWAELRSWVVDWPEYLNLMPIDRFEHVLDRIGLLAEHMRIARRP